MGIQFAVVKKNLESISYDHRRDGLKIFYRQIKNLISEKSLEDNGCNEFKKDKFRIN